MSLLPRDYHSFFSSLKDDIQKSRANAALAVNKELVLLYWRIGDCILANQEKFGWGAKIIDKLSLDLRNEFPEMKGLSLRNLKYMK